MKNHHETKDPAPSFADELHALAALVVEAETMLSSSVSEHSAEALGNLRARFGAAKDSLTEACAAARTKVVAGARYTDDTIRENPFQSMAIALGVGVLFGVIVGRRSQ